MIFWQRGRRIVPPFGFSADRNLLTEPPCHVNTSASTRGPTLHLSGFGGGTFVCPSREELPWIQHPLRIPPCTQDGRLYLGGEELAPTCENKPTALCRNILVRVGGGGGGGGGED